MPFLDKVLPRIDRVDRDRLGGMLTTLARERDLFRQVFNLLGEGIVVTDREGKVTFANRSADSMLTAGRETLEGMRLADVLPDARLRRFIAEALRGRVGILAREMTVERPAPEHLTVTVMPTSLHGAAMAGSCGSGCGGGCGGGGNCGGGGGSGCAGGGSGGGSGSCGR